MKYRVHYFSKYRVPEEGNNKAILIKYANEFKGWAFVTEIATGKVIHRNAALRKHYKNMMKLRCISDEIKSGKPIEQIIDFGEEAEK